MTLVFAYYSYHRFSLINRIAYYMGFYLLLLENQLNNIPGQANTLILFPKGDQFNTSHEVQEKRILYKVYVSKTNSKKNSEVHNSHIYTCSEIS